MTRTRWFWAMLAVLSLVAGAFALRYYSEAFPLLSVDLRMSRSEALDSAARVAGAASSQPAEFSQAASFGQTDPEVQTYVELEGGGPEVFAGLVARGPYRPYVWEVRHFAEGEVAETWFRFTPEGAPYGFREVLPEDAPGASLTAEDARRVAEADALNRWGVDLAAYSVLESSEEVRPGGRTDHTFVYEHGSAELIDARMRLRLVVAGDRPSELTHFVHVPEGFLRRYQEMRSANDTLALVSSLLFLVGFLVLAGGIGSFYLLRHGWVIWRAPLAWGFIVSTLTALGMLNQIGLAWMSYDTAVSRGTFLLQQVGAAVVMVVLGTPLLAFVFLAAESLTRRAFPKQPQQWRLWAKGVVNSDAVLGRTVGAYLWAGIDLGFVVLFYLIVSRLPGWWIPSETLVDPNLLATPFPWLMAVSLSLFAAFWEESLFRAVPLAAAKLLGARFGGVRAWLFAALVLQALVFAAAHANYPQQPPFARVAELFFPALLWGVFYLFFGLLPVILIHFLHNFTFFSIVLFSASDPGLWPDRVLSVAFMLTPLAIVLVARRKWGAVPELPDAFRNAGWSPAAPRAAVEEGEATATQAGVPVTGPAAIVGAATPVPAERGPAPAWVTLAAIAGAVLLVVFSDPRADVPPLEVDRAAAIAVAREAVEARGVRLADWEALALVEGMPSQSARFVWQTAGADAYRELLGSFIAPPQWRVRFVRFTGPVEERAEEWRVAVGPDGEAREITHRLAEGAGGPALEENDARKLAETALRERLQVSPDALREISAEARQRPARRDWLFTYGADEGPDLGAGEARIEVDVAGEEVVSLRRFVHVPEAWEREERSRSTRSAIASLGSTGLVVLLLLVGVVVAVVVWSRGGFAVGPVAAVAIAILALQGVGAVNGFPRVRATFSTAEPVQTQLFEFFAGLVVSGLAVAGGVGLLAGLAHTWLRRRVSPLRGGSWVAGLGGGLALAGGVAAVSRLFPSEGAPEWPSYSGAAVYFPVLTSVVESLTAFVAATAALLVLVAAVERATKGWSRRRMDATITLVWIGVLLYGIGLDMYGTLAADLLRWAVGGVAAGAGLIAVYHLTRRFGAAVVPVLTAVLLSALRWEGALARPIQSSLIGAATAILLMAVAAWWWTRSLEARN